MAKQQSTGRVGKKYVARAQQEAEMQRRVLLGLGAVGILIVLVLLIGLLRTYVLLPRQPVAIVEGVELSTADYRKRFLYEQAFIDEQIILLEQQFEQIQSAFADNPEFQQQLQQQTAQQLNQLAFQRSELANSVYDVIVEEELIRQETERRGLTVSDDELDAAYNARAAGNSNGYTQADANATVTARTQAAENATATAELFTPTPTLTPTDSVTATAVPLPEITPQPTPTINTLTGSALTEAVTTWEQRFDDAANMTPADLREIVRVQLLRQKLEEAIGADLETTAPHTHARHILVETEEAAREVISRLNEGEAFEDLAQELSSDTASAVDGGDLGWFTRDQMVAPFAEAAFAMAVGDISEPVESDFGWHVLEVLGQEDRELEGPTLVRAQQNAYDVWLSGARLGDIEDLRTPDSPPAQLGAR